MKRLWILALLASSACAPSPFRFDDITPQSVQLSENGRPVYAYNHGVMSKEGAPADRNRCCYVHPLYAPNGVVLTDDFPVDHYHHRGVFWAWPIVNVDGERRDLWLMNGIRKRFGRWIAKETGETTARLAFENGWFADETEVVRERVEIVAHRAEGDRRRLDFTLRFEALSSPTRAARRPHRLEGVRRIQRSLRAPREHRHHDGRRTQESGDSDMVPHAWAREDGRFEGGRAGLRIDIDSANPGCPNGWCLRHYGFLGVNFPGNDSYTLRPGEPLELKYAVTVFAIGLMLGRGPSGTGRITRDSHAGG